MRQHGERNPKRHAGREHDRRRPGGCAEGREQYGPEHRPYAATEQQAAEVVDVAMQNVLGIDWEERLVGGPGESDDYAHDYQAPDDPVSAHVSEPFAKIVQQALVQAPGRLAQRLHGRHDRHRREV